MLFLYDSLFLQVNEDIVWSAKVPHAQFSVMSDDELREFVLSKPEVQQVTSSQNILSSSFVRTDSGISASLDIFTLTKSELTKKRKLEKEAKKKLRKAKQIS